MQAIVRTAGNMNALITLWAFATLWMELGDAHEPLLTAALRAAGTMNAMDLSNTLWAFATLWMSWGTHMTH